MTDSIRLRKHLHAALDAALDAYFKLPSKDDANRSSDVILVDPDAGSFTFKWPSEDDIEKYHRSSLYRPAADDNLRIRVGWTRQRRAYGRTPERAIAFRETPNGQRYPLTEFVETDDGMFSADIPDPLSPKSRIRDPGALPARFKDATVRRRDELFGHVQKGPTLRLVLSREDEAAMASHGLWVGKLRGHM